MSDSYREQRPLLSDDYSDEEFDVKSFKYQRRNRPSIRSGRARNYTKGAATILNRWPDNCSTSVAHWWLAVSMIAIIVFVIYNSVLIFGMIPTPDLKQPKYRTFNSEIKPKSLTLPVPNVYMHLITNNKTDKLLNKYLPYAALVSKKYPNFKYNFLVLFNDTFIEFQDLKDEERNEIAFNSLWKNEKYDRILSRKYNISVEYVSLTAFFNDSPIKKFWRYLPPHLIEFLARSVSIWEKGGIAFNPSILIPKLSNPNYIEKLYDILNIFGKPNKESSERKKKVMTKRPNNIQDIINNLDNEDNNTSNINLSEAENNDIVVVSNTNDTIKFKRDSKHISEIGYNNNRNFNEDNLYHSGIKLNIKNESISNSSNSIRVIENILPLFLKYLFENKPPQEVTVNNSEVIPLESSKYNTSLFMNLISYNQNQSHQVKNIFKPIKQLNNYNTTTIIENIASTKKTAETFSISKINKYDNSEPELFVDVKGNIIASKTACHAFLGTMFTNIIKYTERETLTDFIISEVSIFCNGLLTSCPGVRVILL